MAKADHGAYISVEARVKDAEREIKKLRNELGRTKARMDGVRRSTERLKRSSQGFLGVLGRMNPTMVAAAAATAALGIAMRNAAQEALQFDTNMAKVQFLVGVSAESVNMLRQGIVQMAKETGRPIAELSDGMFDIQSASFRGAESLDVLRNAADLAVLGIGTTKENAEALTSALGSWTDGSVSAGNASAALWAGVREGRAEGTAYINMLSQMGAMSSALDISMQDLVGSFAFLTRSMDSATALVSLRGFVKAFIKPSEQMISTLDRFGLSIGEIRDMISKPGGLVNAVELLYETIGVDDIGKLVRDVQGLQGFLAVARNAEEARTVTADVRGSTGDDFADAVAGASGTFMNQFNRALAPMRASFVELGTEVMPVAINTMKVLSTTLGTFADAVSWGIRVIKELEDTAPERNFDRMKGTYVERTGEWINAETRNEMLIRTAKLQDNSMANIDMDVVNEALAKRMIEERAEAARARAENERLRTNFMRAQEMGSRMQNEDATIMADAMSKQLSEEFKRKFGSPASPSEGEADARALVHAGRGGRNQGEDFQSDLLADLREEREVRIQNLQIMQSGEELTARQRIEMEVMRRITQERADAERDLADAQRDLEQATTDEDAQAARERLAAARERLSVLRELGLQSPAVQALINDLAELDEKIKEASETEELARAWKSVMESSKGHVDNFFMTLIDGTKSAKDAFKDMARSIMNDLLQMMIRRQITERIFGALPTFGMRQFGGPVIAGQPYVVGERGPEIMVPDRSGHVQENADSGGGTSSITVVIEGMQGADIDRKIAEAIPVIRQLAKGDAEKMVIRRGPVRRRVTGR